MADTKWATAQLTKLLGLDDESAKQVLDYTNSLSKDAAAEHLKNMLGDSPQALEFISSFNSRRGGASRDQSPAPAPEGVPKTTRSKKNTKKSFNTLPPPRRPDDFGHVEGGYQKKGLAEDYMPASSRSRDASGPSSRNLSPAPAAVKAPVAATGTLASEPPPITGRSFMADLPNVRSRQASPNPKPKPPPSAAGTLISDLPNVRSRQASPNPKAKTKVHMAGGTPMHGASEALNDLDSAIRSLEMQTNPTMADQNPAARACDCLATKHPLLAAAPNCLACGKIICAKEGLGPCTFCSTPLLSSEQIQDMIRELKIERGHERQSVHNASHRKADVSLTPRPFQTPRSGNSPSSSGTSTPSSLAAAQAHRDKLLNFQAQNAQRTTVRDEAADFDTPGSGTNMWSSPVERAQQLKRQQKILREMEWAAKPEYEKRKVVMSVDIVGGKVVRRYGTAQNEKPKEEEPDEVPEPVAANESSSSADKKGAFGKNPLLGGLIKPVWKMDGAVTDTNGSDGPTATRKRSQWRKVQDDQDDNEEMNLDGGVYGIQQDVNLREEPDSG